MENVRWIKTSVHTYFAIWHEHHKELGVYASFTEPEGGTELSWEPHIMTTWGFKNSDYPLIKCERSKGDREQKEWDTEYFIADCRYPED